MATLLRLREEQGKLAEAWPSRRLPFGKWWTTSQVQSLQQGRTQSLLGFDSNRFTRHLLWALILRSMFEVPTRVAKIKATSVLHFHAQLYGNDGMGCTVLVY